MKKFPNSNSDFSVARSKKNNGYIGSAGALPARQAVAKFMSVKEAGVVYKPEVVPAFL